MKDLAIQYFEEMAQEADKDNPNRVPITVRVYPHVVRMLERIAKEVGKSRAEVGADVLSDGAQELALYLAQELQMDDDAVRKFVYGVGENVGGDE